MKIWPYGEECCTGILSPGSMDGKEDGTMAILAIAWQYVVRYIYIYLFIHCHIQCKHSIQGTNRTNKCCEIHLCTWVPFQESFFLTKSWWSTPICMTRKFTDLELNLHFVTGQSIASYFVWLISKCYCKISSSSKL